MSAELRTHIDTLIRAALVRVTPDHAPVAIALERPKQSGHGDYATNAAMQLAKGMKKPSRAIAEAIVAALPNSDWIGKVEVAGPGFINFYATPASKHRIVKTILTAGDAFGRSNEGGGKRVLVEFVSANPTGPLHVGHGRQAALGDAIAALLAARGYAVTREFYYNDAGVQIANLALSVQARAKELAGTPMPFPENGYHGEYIREIARDFLSTQGVGAVEDLEAIRRFAVAALRKEQDVDLQAFGVKFDHYYLESSLYADGRVDAAVAALERAGQTYESEGALWLRTTAYGDDKDRVMRKSDGGYTYFVPDVAYHITKWERGFAKAINVQGADHHGTIARVRAGLQAVGRDIPLGYPDYLLHKMVTVMKGGEEVKLSKRAGSYVTVRDLIDEVGRDAVRFFLVSRKANTEFIFDVDLAKSQSEENPVYYVQYAHARISSMMREWSGRLDDVDLAPLVEPREAALLQQLADYPDVLASAVAELAPHQVAFYLRELAGEFHSYYNAVRILKADEIHRLPRLAMCAAIRQVLKNGLALIGVSAPERM
ncbi:MAG: arginine--tRNA ligase [Betaproteobacteria bacterium]|nr:arginine--tRNA ligase [Betaproteobacteria bacterium]